MTNLAARESKRQYLLIVEVRRVGKILARTEERKRGVALSYVV